MNWSLYKQADYQSSQWSGGTTTQLAIAPEGAVYAQRDFLWRLSSAAVELPHSDFTPLPNYERLLSVVKGEMELKIGAGEIIPLHPYQVCAFDGGAAVESWGQCTDFNLMVRKGACQGTVQALTLAAGAQLSLTVALPATADYPNTAMALFCAQGSVRLSQGDLCALAGELLLCPNTTAAPISITSTGGGVVLAAFVRSR